MALMAKQGDGRDIQPGKRQAGRPAPGRVHTSRARTPDGPRTRQGILDAARSIFAEKGYSGANVNEIVALAGTTKPMIYYHFCSKEGLFAAVLEEVYAGMRAIERSLQLQGLPPDEAMRRLVQVTFDYHAEHPEWVRLISVANIHGAQHILDSPTIASQNAAILAILAGLLARGEQEGAFRAGVDPLHLHLMINSMCFYRVSNRHTWRVIFGRDLSLAEDAAQQRTMLADAVVRYLSPDQG
ncbi:MAG: TetR family transcriptional regulator [Janthinobacterium lividum]